MSDAGLAPKLLETGRQANVAPRSTVPRGNDSMIPVRSEPLMHLVLGIWLGGSVILGAVVSYNLSGIGDLFDRNPRLQEHAGFSVDDADARKSSLIWVHSSELNRVFFEVWNRTQLILGGLAVLLAVVGGSRWLPIVLLTAATVLVALIHVALEPQLVEMGRQLDFMPRNPPPPMLADFQRSHGIYFAVESLRFGLLSIATLLLLVREMRSARQ